MAGKPCVEAVNELWRRAKALGVDQAQWRAAWRGALIAARHLDAGGIEGSQLAAVLKEFRSYEGALRGVCDELKLAGVDNTPAQIALVEAVGRAEAERGGVSGK